MQDITISDASVLKNSIYSQYSIEGISALKPIELSSRKTVKVDKYGDYMTIGKSQTQHPLYKPLEKSLGIKQSNQENKLD